MMADIARWGLTDGIRLARTVGSNLRDRLRYTPAEFVESAERATKLHPNEWVVFFSLADKCMELGYLAKALQACKRAVELKPNDIRSTYALATAYNTLTRADWAPRRQEFLDVIALLEPPAQAGPFDPNIALTEMTELGMVVDTAAAQAIRWFERSLALRPDTPSRRQIMWDLDTLYKRFPHLRH
jgi:tetratricopeptide (TPR) repeat protein